MKKQFFLLLFVSAGASQQLLARRQAELNDVCSAPDGSCSHQGGPVVSTTFCPGSGCPCTAKICRECEDCPM